VKVTVEATDELGSTNAKDDADGVVVDNEDPTIDDAWIYKADGSNTWLAVTFSEAVGSLSTGAETGDFSLESGETVTAVQEPGSGSAPSTLNGHDDFVLVKVSGSVQTGGIQNVSYTDQGNSISETNGGESAVDSDAQIHTMKLDLSKGKNLVSVPAAAGEIDLDANANDLQSAGVTIVWTYEDGQWKSWTPSPSDTDGFKTMEGGQGYIFVTNSDDTLTVDVYNVPTNVGSGPSVPMNTQTLDEGWNLVGHYQEGDQGIQSALYSIDGSYSNALQQSSAGSLSYSTLDTSTGTMKPGEAYWVFVTQDGEQYTESQYGAAA
jgi:hypothetical protein